MLEFNIERLRGSIFVPQIAFNWNFIFKMKELLPDYLPSVISENYSCIQNAESRLYCN